MFLAIVHQTVKIISLSERYSPRSSKAKFTTFPEIYRRREKNFPDFKNNVTLGDAGLLLISGDELHQ